MLSPDPVLGESSSTTASHNRAGPPGASRVLVADDHEVVRLGLRSLLSCADDLEIVGEAATAADAVRLAAGRRPHVVLMDVRLPDDSGLEACRRIRQANPDVNVIMLSSFSDEETVVGAILAGASGYMLKKAEGVALLEAIRGAAAGDPAMDARSVGAVVSRLRSLSTTRAEADGAGLSLREQQVLDLVSEGHTNREIASRLALSEKTVRNYVSDVLRKLGLRSRSAAAAWAVERRLMRPYER